MKTLLFTDSSFNESVLFNCNSSHFCPPLLFLVTERMNQPDLFGNNEIVKGTRADRTDPAPTTSLLSKQGRNDALKKQFTTYVKRVKEDSAL
jgi:hypothetical protein